MASIEEKVAVMGDVSELITEAYVAGDARALMSLAHALNAHSDHEARVNTLKWIESTRSSAVSA